MEQLTEKNNLKPNSTEYKMQDCSEQSEVTYPLPNIKKNSSSFLSFIKKHKKIIIPVASLIIVLLCFLSFGKTKNFIDRYPTLDAESWCYISSDGAELYISFTKYDFYEKQQVKRINKALGIPGFKLIEMENTDPSDGKQSFQNSKVIVYWKAVSSHIQVDYILKRPTEVSPAAKNLSSAAQTIRSKLKFIENKYSGRISFWNIWYYENYSMHISIILHYVADEDFIKIVSETYSVLQEVLTDKDIDSFNVSFTNYISEDDYFMWQFKDYEKGDLSSNYKEGYDAISFKKMQELLLANN